jgi:malonate transporter and related proteins
MLIHFFLLALPLFGLVLAGYLISSVRAWKREWTKAVSSLTFGVAIPVMLFQLISSPHTSSAVDARLLFAFFGGCLIVFAIGRVIAARVFELDGVSQSVFAMAGIFSNNVMLGLPLAKLTLGAAAVTPVALVLIFNALTLWTLISVSVEWARHGSVSAPGVVRTFLAVLRNPIVIGILLGALSDALDWRIQGTFDRMLHFISDAASPAALLVLGMGLKHYELKHRWRQSAAMCGIKLFVQPLVVWLLALALGLPALETQVVVLLASLAVGVNVYLMALQFERLESAVASSLMLSTVLASITTPLWLALVTRAH